MKKSANKYALRARHLFSLLRGRGMPPGSSPHYANICRLAHLPLAIPAARLAYDSHLPALPYRMLAKRAACRT